MTYYYCPYDGDEEEANIYTIVNARPHFGDDRTYIYGQYKSDGNYDEFNPDYIYQSVDDCLDHISNENIRINLDGEPIQYSKDELEMMAYEEASGDHHDYDDKE